MGHDLGHGKLNESRMEILLASIVRAINASGAIQRLYADRPYSEEIHTLLRTLVELVINAAYLQICSEGELASYRQYDTLMLSKVMRLANELFPGCIDHISEPTRNAFSKHTDEVRQATAGTVANTSWTKLDLHSRAVAADKHLGTQILQFLRRFVYSHGHTYTHGTFSSLEVTIDSFRTGQFPEARAREDADFALFGTAQTLHVFAMTINLLKNIGFDAHLSVVQDLLKQYNDAPSTIPPQPEP